MPTLDLPTSSAAAANAVQVRQCSQPEVWDDFVNSSPDGTVCHLYRWKTIIEKAYRQRSFYLAAFDEDRLRGVLPLVLTKSLLFGNHLTSMPYLDCGGILSEDDRARQALLQEARTLAKEHRAELCLRCLHDPQLNLPVSLRRVTMVLKLDDRLEDLWTNLPSNRRNRIRKAEKNGLTTTWHREDGLRDFYDIFAHNMRDLCSPVHGISLFREILTQLGEQAAIVLVRDHEQTIGAAFCLFYKTTMSIPWASSLRSHFKMCPNQLIYWDMIRYGVAHGYRFADFGRSVRGDGTFEFKRKWGAEPVQLHWVYESATKDGANKTPSQQYGKAAQLWHRLPLSLTKFVGPWIRKGIPG